MKLARTKCSGELLSLCCQTIIDDKSVLAAIERYKTHPSIIKITQLIKPNRQFISSKLVQKRLGMKSID